MLDHRPRAVADEIAGGRQADGFEALLGEDRVEAPDQVRRGVDEGAVEIEGDRGAFQAGEGVQRTSPVETCRAFG
jgi:hypothetical protein